MWCSRVQKLLSAHLDGELSPADVSRVEEHLARCERCSREQATLRRLTRLTALVPDEEAPAGLRGRILASISVAATSTAPPPRAMPRRAAGGLFAPWAPVALAGVTVAAAVGYLAVNQQGNPPSQVANHTTEAPVRREVVATPAPEVVVPVTPQEPVKSSPPVIARRDQEMAERPEPSVVVREAREEAHPVASRPKVGENERSVREVAVVAKRPRRSEAAVTVEPRSPRMPASVIAGLGSTTDKRTAEASPTTTVVTQQNMLPLPAEPMVVASSEATQPQPLVAGLEGDGSTRMAGAAMDGGMPAQDEDGLRALRVFLQERNQAVPQPTLLSNPQRQMRKL